MCEHFGYIELKQAADIWLDSSNATHGDPDIALHEAETWWSIFREVEIESEKTDE